MKRISLSGRPLGQKAVAALLLAPNFWLPPRVTVNLEGGEKIPDEPVIYAMNHTDRYNYWPFQFQLLMQEDRFTATWVKGKYYQNWLLGRFMEWTNNIPTVSRGYLIARDFLNVMGRPPETPEYETLRAMVDASAYDDRERMPPAERIAEIPTAVFEQRRDILGLEFDPAARSWAEVINDLFQQMMDLFVALNGEAFNRGLDLLIFPQGTRSIRLSQGRIGIAQIALYYQRPIVPVGCNGSDLIYPGSSPVARPGEVTYRVGEPMTVEEMEPYAIHEGFQPFRPEAETKHRERFQALVDDVMWRINDLLDPKYQFAEDQRSDGVGGASRFV